MKTIKTILILCAAVCCFASCKKDVDMTLVQKTLFENTDIQQIEVSDAWQVTVVKDTMNTFVELEYSAYLQDYVSAQTENNRLKINFNKSVYVYPGSVYKAVVHTGKIENLEISEASKVSFEGGHFSATSDSLILSLADASVCSGLDYSGNECRITLKGASHFLDFQLSGINCEVNVKDASTCKGSFDMSFHFVADLDDASQLIAFGGSAPFGIIRLQNACLLNMAQTDVREMHVELSGASEATVQVSEGMEGTLKEASTLYYKGHPQIDIDCFDDSQLIPF